MKRLYPLFLLLLLCSACSSDSDYHYPSVKLEFLTAHTGADKQIASVITDAGQTFSVLYDGSKLELPADTTLRILTNYEPMTAPDGTLGVRLYKADKVVAPLPRPADYFKQGIKTDPAELLSGWMGHEYLNLILTIKAQEGKHIYHFVEDSITTHSATEETTLYLTLYHDAGGDTVGYTQRSYLSVPLRQYGPKVRVQMRITGEKEVKTHSF